jgi:ubiquinone/menaquinone biosynthesis C-methylase UbiE
MLPRILEKVVAIPGVYDLVQKLAGRDENSRRLKPFLEGAHGELLLDAGAGTGEIRKTLTPSIRYLWLDEDPQKLSGFLAKFKERLAILGSVTNLPLAERSIHTVLCVAVAHHLPDQELDKTLAGFARVCRERFVFLDPLKIEGSNVSSLLWRYDRGSYPRTAECLTAMIEKYFVLEAVQHYSIYHHYILWVGRPIRPVVVS